MAEERTPEYTEEDLAAADAELAEAEAESETPDPDSEDLKDE